MFLPEPVEQRACFAASGRRAASGDEMLNLNLVRELYASVTDPVHDLDHVLRVAALAERIARAEGADVDVVVAAAWLHDLPSEGRENHAKEAAARAKHILEENTDWPPERIENAVHAVRAHRFRDRSVMPRTLEAKVLYDADKLDAIGAIGVARAFAYAGLHGERLWAVPPSEVDLAAPVPEGRDYTPVHELVYKLSRIKSTLYTATARRIAEDRHAFMLAFFGRLQAEVEGRR